MYNVVPFEIEGLELDERFGSIEIAVRDLDSVYVVFGLWADADPESRPPDAIVFDGTVYFPE